MLGHKPDGTPIHYARDANKFEFDAEVASIFPNMVKRSIPLYQDTHRIICQIVVDRLYGTATDAYDILINKPAGAHKRLMDVGCSVGGFFLELYRAVGVNPLYDNNVNWRLCGVDPSGPMRDAFNSNLPNAGFLQMDAATLNYAVAAETQDVINMSYVLQFTPVPKRQELFIDMYRLLKPGGMLIVSNKDTVVYSYGGAFDRLYREFRLSNGYTPEEIDEKTAALKSVMWTQAAGDTRDQMLEAGFISIQEVTRYLQFSTKIAVKPS